MNKTYQGQSPNIAPDAFIAETAVLIGKVTVGARSSIWYGTVLRGDSDHIYVGEGSSVQDNAVIHCERGSPTRIGNNVTVGHGAIVHGSTIGDNCLIGMGSVVLNGCTIGVVYSEFILPSLPKGRFDKHCDVMLTEKGKEVGAEVMKKIEKVLEFSKKIDHKKINEQNESLASRGYRVIALANGKVKKQDKYEEKDIKNLTFMGMVGFIDPIRKEVVQSISECKSAGIKVLMITGDHPLTAFSIAKELDLTSDYKEVTTGLEVDEYYKKGDLEFDRFVKSKKVFTRVTPLQKLNIVESLKRQGEFVAVTGDGVNDAPALKSANIGVAMGSGTDIARETAKMIIMDDNFKSIVAGVKEGRVAFANIRKIIYFLLSCGLAEVIFFCLSIISNLPMPLVAIQLLWINVVTDGIQDFALSFEKAEEGILKEKPRDPKESIFNRSLLKEIIVAGLVIVGVVFSVWYLLLNKLNMDVSIARGYIMALMVFIQNIHVFNCRSEKKSAFKVPIKNNLLIVYGVLVSVLLQIIVMEIPFLSKLLKTTSIPFIHIIYLAIIASSVLIIIEIYKKINYKK